MSIDSVSGHRFGSFAIAPATSSMSISVSGTEYNHDSCRKTPPPKPVLQMSEEQAEIFHHIQNGYNVMVDSCAGSGKSTTIISIAKRMPHATFLQLTYNTMLRKEFKEKTHNENVTNIEVHTYHSFAVKYFQSDMTHYTDSGLRNILYKKAQPSLPIPLYDVVVIDECQDLTHLYFQFIRYFLSLPPVPPSLSRRRLQLLILGDYMQCLYEFKGADARFLTLADILWQDFPILKTPEFKKCTLKTSYRITNQMAKFVNNVMIGNKRIHACRDGPPVVYIRNSRSNIEKIVIHHIKQILADGDLPEDIFVLGASVKGMNSNIRKMENCLVEEGIPCHVPMLENDKMDERVISGKIVFSTFHSVKGRQRKYVFIIGFDQSYFSMYARNIPQDVCPNTLYVACTRATHKMFLLENNQYSTDRPLDFLRLGHHDMKRCDYIDFKGHPQLIFYESVENNTNITGETKRFVTPTELIKFVPETIIEQISPILQDIFVSHGPSQELEIPSVVALSNGLFEDVSDLNGIAIPAIYADYIHAQSDQENILYQLIGHLVQDMKENEYVYLKQVYKDLNPICKTTQDYLYMANVYSAFQEKLYFKLKQIQYDEYNWLSEDIIAECAYRLDTVLGNETILSQETTFIQSSDDSQHSLIDSILGTITQEDGKLVRYRFSARLDMITSDSIWELKCTSQIITDHLLQVVIYAWLWKCVYPKDTERKFFIFNIRTNEVIELRNHVDFDKLTTIVKLLLKGKYEKENVLNNQEFLESCKNR